MRSNWAWLLVFLVLVTTGKAIAADAGSAKSPPKACVDGTEPGFVELTFKDFTPVNGAADTWSEKGGVIHCAGKPVGVSRSEKEYTNFEFVAQWKHLESGGNSGFFLWAPGEALAGLKPGQLPKTGIEVQVLDHGYAEQWEKTNKKKPDWFTTNGDVFPVANSRMKPFEPAGPNSRSFPRKNLSKGVGEWNHYYVRAINGEVRLWVNGEEVSGGRDCEPRTGYFCLESEGAPVEFKNIRIRELP